MDHPDDLRFTEALYTVGEAARFLGVPPSTMATWAGGYRRRRPGGTSTEAGPVVTALPADRNLPRIPFVGLAEAMVVAAFRRAGVSLQHIRKALDVLETQLGIEHVLASQRLYTDGSVVLFDYAQRHIELAEELAGLTVVVTQQRVFSDVVRDYLDRISYAPDGWAQDLVLPLTQRSLVRVDPRRAFGQPFFIHGNARMEDVIDRFVAGDPLADVAEDFGVPQDELEDVLRAILRPAA
jgi:uncharacterized protein (DUF433 family)/DNA-binding transcriptional MerR regulator